METPRLHIAYRWQNDMVMCFDGNGVQIPNLQGKYEDVREAVLAAADSRTTFMHGEWREYAQEVRREDW